MVVRLLTHICVARPQWVPDFHSEGSWWRHQMETFSALLALCEGNSPVNSPHKGQWRGAFMLSLIRDWINRWVNNREAGDLRCHRAHNDVIIIIWPFSRWEIVRKTNLFFIYPTINQIQRNKGWWNDLPAALQHYSVGADKSCWARWWELLCRWWAELNQR